jgi:hypothetical protein
MNYSTFEEEYLEILMKIESSIFKTFVQYPELTDYEVDTALECLVRTFHGELSGRPTIQPKSPLSLNVYGVVRDVCDGERKGSEDRENTDILTRCLKRLRKSIALWTKEGGRQGYLNYLSQFFATKRR